MLGDVLSQKVAANPGRWQSVQDAVSAMSADERARVEEYIGGNKNRAGKVLDRLQAGKPWQGTDNATAAAEQEQQRSEAALQRSQAEQQQWAATNAAADAEAQRKREAAAAKPPTPTPTLTDRARENPRKYGLKQRDLDNLPADGIVGTVVLTQNRVGGYDQHKPGDVVRINGRDHVLLSVSDEQRVKYHQDAPVMHRQTVTARPATPQEAERYQDMQRIARNEREIERGTFMDMDQDQVRAAKDRMRQENAALRAKHGL